MTDLGISCLSARRSCRRSLETLAYFEIPLEICYHFESVIGCYLAVGEVPSTGYQGEDPIRGVSKNLEKRQTPR